MNRRQRKKAYKKRYGYNPPRTEAQYHCMDWTKAFENIASAIADAGHRMVDVIQQAVSSLGKVMQSVTETIKSMSEEEFEQMMASEDIEQSVKALMWRIRMSDSHAQEEP